MKTKVLLLAALMMLPMMQLSAKKKPSYRNSDYKAGNFALQNGKLYYEKVITSAIPLTKLAENLESKNAPQAGIQVKSADKEAVRGVFIRKSFDWAGMGYKPKKIPWFARMPMNGNFEMVAMDKGYRVRVTDMWFTNQLKPSSNQHMKLEDIVLKKGGMALSKNKKTMRGLEILDKGISEIFAIQGSGLGSGF
ncbi:MAG TPA: hypothetical protein PKE03_07375 [Bacteroidales bacterium]|nr:hypothetical protein [Bacteroidales bacterium]